MEVNEKNFTQQHNMAENAVHEMFLAIDMVQTMLKAMNPAILFDLEKYHPKAYKKFKQHKNNFYYQVMFNNIHRGISEGVYKQVIHADILARYRVSAVFLIFDTEVFPSTKYHLNEVFWEITANYLHGLVTTKGNIIHTYTSYAIKHK